MQSFFKTSLILFSTLMVCGNAVSAASYQAKRLSCHADSSMEIIHSVDAIVSMRLGHNYEIGNDVSQDDVQAFDWYCNAAMQNDADAQLKVALLLLEGKGSKRDLSKGMDWLNRAANNGSHDAELALGILLVDTDAIRSAVFFKQAAAGGNLYANHRLAELYYYGMGVPQDYDKAQALSELGVAAGFEKSKELLIRIQMKQASSRLDSDKSESSIASVKVESQEKGGLFQSFLSMLPSLPSLPSINTGEVGAPAEVTETEPEAVEEGTQQQASEMPSKLNEVLIQEQAEAVDESSIVKNKPDSSSTQSTVRGIDWINQQPDVNYTIQLVQSTNPDGINKYIKRHDLDNNAYYIRVLQGKQDRYILLYGNYPDISTTKQIVKALSPAIQKSDYWIRSFANLRRSYVISP